MKGSDLYEILNNCSILIIGTSALIIANYIKSTRYCLQVSLCTIYLKLKEAKNTKQSIFMPIEWLETRTDSS